MDKKHQHDNTHEHDHKHGDTEHTHEHDHSQEHGHNEGSHGHKHGGCCGQHGKDDEACCKNEDKQVHVHGGHHNHDHSHEGHHHHHDHDHEGHDHDEEPITLDLILDDGKEVKCEVVGIFEVEGKEYIALLPFDDDRVLLYTYEEVDDELNLENIEDDEIFKKVSETFWEIFGDDDFEKIDEE